LRDKKDFKNGNNKERCKELGIPDYFIERVEFTDETKTAKNELEDEFIKGTSKNH
jgi:hypothetical protein